MPTDVRTEPSPPAPGWGVSLLPTVTVARVVEQATIAESLGFDRCWVYDEGLGTRELWITLTAVGLATDRMAVGPGITNPYTRHVGVTAAAAATLDELTGGRVFVGFGVGGSLALDPLVIERRRPALAIREAIDGCRLLWRGGPANLAGGVVTLHHARLDYGPPTIPIWVAGRGPRVLATGGARADGVSLDHIHRDFLAGDTAHVREAAARAGTVVRLAYATTIVTTDAALERARRHMTYRLVDSPPSVKEAIGLTRTGSDAIRSALPDGLEAAARFVKDDWVLPFIVHGTAGECATALAGLCRDHGFDELIVPIPDSDFAEATMATAAEVRQFVDGAAPG
ncbi:MAG TPA: LLM class flavin-dependent oxidoreductase [Acidimicrobiia bacterium]|nr:LLM class flavin-dependent oxidoreductase [Acidimicrobiia bacterium]